MTSLVAAVVLLSASYVRAQGPIVSSTAAWSSQIVAFWGAVGLGARLSATQKITNPFTSLVAICSCLRRALNITSALEKGSWTFLSPGLMGGAVRVHVVVITWRTKAELLRLALRVALLAETLAVKEWTIVVVGRKLQQPDSTSQAVWTMCPRIPAYSTVRQKYSAELVPFIDDSEIQNLILQTQSDPQVIAKTIADLGHPATRMALYTEVTAALQDTPAIARRITSWQIPETTSPFIHINKGVWPYGLSRLLSVNTATLTYVLVHLAVCVAIGLMAAATGRGLAVWLFSTRIVISQIDPGFTGAETLLTLTAFGGQSIFAELFEDNIIAAGDTILTPLQFRYIVLAVVLNLVEFGVIVGGWIYGARQAQRFPPTGLVGHGMLWLAIVVCVLLAARALGGLKERMSARIIGIFEVPANPTSRKRLVIHEDCVLDVPNIADRTQRSLHERYILLRVISSISSQTSNDTNTFFSILRLVRSPTFAETVEEFAVEQCMSYEYDGDALVCIRKAKRQHPRNPSLSPLPEKQRPISDDILNRPRGWTYPWKSFTLCILIIILCASASATYAYVPKTPRWVKLVVEAIVSVCALYIATLDRTSPLPHLQPPYMSFMVAATVVCSVWYVGVEGVG